MSENRIAFVARGPAVITGRHYKISWGKPAKGTFPLPLSLFAPPSLLPTISFSLTPGQQPALSAPGFVHPPVVTARIRIFSVDRRYFFAVIPLTLSLVSSPVYSYARYSWIPPCFLRASLFPLRSMLLVLPLLSPSLGFFVVSTLFLEKRPEGSWGFLREKTGGRLEGRRRGREKKGKVGCGAEVNEDEGGSRNRDAIPPNL